MIAEREMTVNGAARRITSALSPPVGSGLLDVSWLPLAELRQQPAYQRNLRFEKVRRIAAEFDPRLFGAVTVARYPNGTLAGGPADGRHRVEALALKFEDHTMLVPCFVIDVADEREEARLFEKLNRDRAPVSAADIFRSRLARGEPSAAALQRTVARAGWDIQAGDLGNKPWNVLKSPVAVEELYKTSPAALVEVLEFLNATWHGQPECKHERTLNGVHHLLVYYGSQRGWDESRVREALSHIALKTILRRTLGYMGGSHIKRGETVGDEFARTYNDNRPKGTLKLNVPVRAESG